MARLPTNTDVFNAIAEPKRREILDILAGGELSVNEIAEALDLPQPQTSKYLRVLKEVELVTLRRAGKQRFYRLRGEALKPVYDWVGSFEQMWVERLDRLADYLDKLQEKGERE